jgi:hypothetical protein
MTISKTGLAAMVLLAGAPAAAADFAVIKQELVVDRPAQTVWAKVGADYCGIGQWMRVKCEYASGSGDVGTVRRIADRISEVMVARSPLSYTYADLDPKLLYHGTLAVEPVDARRSKIVYTLVYDQQPIGDAAAQTADRTRRAAIFKRAMDSMKAMAEAR